MPSQHNGTTRDENFMLGQYPVIRKGYKPASPVERILMYA
jgi:hypothetical protein